MIPPCAPLLRGTLLAVAAALVACAVPHTRFDAPVAMGLAQEPMRHLETAHVELYYPESYAAVARRIVGRLDSCVVSLRAKALVPREPDKLLAYLTLANFNNAYVQPEAPGYPLQMVLPIHTTLDTDNLLGFGTVNEGDVSCHEALHYVQNEQTHGIWGALNNIFGGLVTSSQGLERWFTEGLAVWTEGHSVLHTGRPYSPFWRGVFMSAMETRNFRPREGDLSIATRDLYGSGAYLTASFFIDYLVEQYGEASLWTMIEAEGGSAVPDFGVPLRFRDVYGRTLPELVEDYGEWLEKTAPRRTRPADQKVLSADLGYFARVSVSPFDGALAEVSDGYDTPSRLVLRERNGDVRFIRRLTEVLPLRHWIDASAQTISGLRFSHDGRWLYVLSLIHI